MNLKINNLICLVLLSFLSFTVNYYYGSIGVLPIDTFAFFDTGYRLNNGDLPFKDYWTISGPFIDILQSFFFYLFGYSWKSYILNGSIINLILTVTSYYFFKNNGLDYKYSFFYASCLAFLGNPSMGTPFPDHYSSFFSLLALISFISAIKTKKNVYWFLIPILLFIAFFCKQTPAGYVIILFLFNFACYALIEKKLKFLKPITYGALVSFLLLMIFILKNEIDIKSIITQYFLYPQTIGTNRINELGFSFNKYISNFKLIYVVLIPLIGISLLSLFSKNKSIKTEDLFINFNIIFFSFILLIHQWLTLNFIFIFFLIPFLCYTIHKNFVKKKSFTIISVFLLSFCLIATVKYHFRFNEERKMIHLENIDLENYFDAEEIFPNLKGLKWITHEYNFNSKKEKERLKFFSSTLKKEEKKIMFLSNYQFYSTMLNKNLHSPNRWYGGNVAHPQKENIYYSDYLKFVHNLILKNKVEIILIDQKLGSYHVDFFKEILKNFPNECSKINNLNDMLIRYEIINCY